MKKTTLAIFILVALVILAVAGVYFYKISFGKKGPVACTADARLCPDGTAVGRSGPNCEYDACPVKPGDIDKTPIYDPAKEDIQSLFIKKYPKYAKTIEIVINKEVPGYIRGQVSFERGAPGGIFFTRKVDGKWEISHDGNGEIPCSLSDLGFPMSMLDDCAK